MQSRKDRHREAPYLEEAPYLKTRKKIKGNEGRGTGEEEGVWVGGLFLIMEEGFKIQNYLFQKKKVSYHK